MTDLQKAKVTLGGEVLAGTGGVVWQFTTGVAPYRATFSVHKRRWPQLGRRMGKPLDLVYKDSRGVTTTIKDVYILHKVPSDKPSLVSFVVADRRWKWSYQIVHRDYNIKRKTGDKDIFEADLPLQLATTVDAYDYLRYSLTEDGERWTAKQAVEDLLEQIENPTKGGKWRIKSWPIKDGGNAPPSGGQFTLQDVRLRDQADIALARLLAYVPGAEIYVDQEGQATVFDGADIRGALEHYNKLPPYTWNGQKAEWVDLKQVRPRVVTVYYPREVELVCDYEDDLSEQTRARNIDQKNLPFLENVLPTPDPITEIIEWDPEVGSYIPKTVPAGTWVEMSAWLEAMELDRQKTGYPKSSPWTFDTIRRAWIEGDLEEQLGGKPDQDMALHANIQARIHALRQHFRQTFRLNRRYMERIAAIRNVRASMLDPVTGQRAPSLVWGHYTVHPVELKRASPREKDGTRNGIFRVLDHLQESESSEGVALIDTPPSPARVEIRDSDLGIIRVEFAPDPYGSDGRAWPFKTVRIGDEETVEEGTHDLSLQDEEPIGVGTRVENGSNELGMAAVMKLRLILTIVPASPNNANLYHYVDVSAKDVDSMFRTEFGIDLGVGPPLELLVSPTEATARLAWKDDAAAQATVREMLGLDVDDPNTAGIVENNTPGFVLVNERRELQGHAVSFAAEMMAGFADSLQGTVATRVPDDGRLELVGNMASTAISITGAPSARTEAFHVFPGRQKPISRLSMMPDATRQLILGILPYR